MAFHFISKPQTKKKGKKFIAKLEEKLKRAGVAYEFHYTKSSAESISCVRALTEAGERTIIAVGGDGTVNDVLTGLSNPEECTIGLIPNGTGNDFSASANIPKGLPALDLILNGEAKPTDYIQCEGERRSMNIAGVGVDVDILVRCEKGKFLRGKAKYFLSLLVSLFKFRGFEVEVSVNGETAKYQAFIAAVCNGKQFGGGMVLCPPASIDDGKMELVIVDYPKRSKIPNALVKLMGGKVLSLPFAKHITCESAIIRPALAGKAQYDGELYDTEALQANLVTGKLKMFR